MSDLQMTTGTTSSSSEKAKTGAASASSSAGVATGVEGHLLVLVLDINPNQVSGCQFPF